MALRPALSTGGPAAKGKYASHFQEPEAALNPSAIPDR